MRKRIFGVLTGCAIGFGLIATSQAASISGELMQWDILFTHMNDKGLGFNCMLAECENEEALDGNATTALGDERKLYYREMVARFAHHLDIKWIISEENGVYAATGIIARNKTRMKCINDLDPYDHAIVLLDGKVKSVTGGANRSIGLPPGGATSLDWIALVRNYKTP